MKKLLTGTPAKLIAMGLVLLGFILAGVSDSNLIGFILITPGLLLLGSLWMVREIKATRRVGQTAPCPTCNGSGRVEIEEE